MPERSFPLDGSTYDDAATARVLRAGATDGVVAGVDNEALVTATSPETDDVRVLTGRVWTGGALLEVYDSPELVALAASTADDRWDRIVARRDFSTPEVTLAVLQGTPAASPTKPALTQTQGGVWETLLADVWIPGGSTQIFADEASATAGEGWVEDRRTWTASPSAQVTQQVVFSASGTFSKQDYPGLVAVKVRCVAAGGGGGGAGTPSAGYGGGGGSGAYAEEIIPHSQLALSETVTVGSGGAGGGGASNGSNGGDSSFGSHVSCGGGSGGGTNTGADVAGGGNRGTATGDVAINGSIGERGCSDGTIASGGRGGGSALHGGGNGLKVGSSSGVSFSGTDGVAGSGGGGGVNGGGGAAAGGDGGDGLVIVEIIG